MTHTETGSPSFAAGDVFAADPEVGRDLARVDWAGTPLGDPSGWPQSLQTAVRILLRSRFSMWMAWGPELTFFCNAAYRKQTLADKYPWALGRPAREVWAEIWDDIGPRIDHVFGTGEATWDEGLQLILERSGFPEESYHTFSYSALSDDDGRIVGMLCVVSEDTTRVIGERRMTTLRELGSDPDLLPSEEQTLQTAAAKLSRNPYDLPFALLYLFDGDGHARLVAGSGLPIGHRAAPDVLDVVSNRIWPCGPALEGRSTVIELDSAPFDGLPSGPWPEPPTRALLTPLVQQGVAPYGVLIAGLNRYRPLDDAYRGFIDLVAGHIAGEIGSARSYLAEQRRAAELTELDRAKTVFFSNVSHEFRTPLTLMLGPVAELLGGDDARLDADIRRDLEIVQRNGLRLTKLVNTLLDFARIEADRMQARYVPLDAPTLTAELASGFRSAVERAGLTFVVDCPPLDEPLYLDRDMWEKVVLNILSNAVKFTAEGSITVRTGRDESHAVVTIADTGIGVSAAELPRLFERFHRIPATWARSHEGSGIGLALVRELVTLHGGTITAESAEGVGTTFTVRIPFGTAHLPPQSLGARAEGGDSPSPAQAANPYLEEALRWLPDAEGGDEAPAQAAVPSTAARVLVADDNADMRRYITRLLTGAGYVVEQAADGRHALDIIRNHPPELVVSDVMMPYLDGLELVAELRSDPRTAALPVLLLSARAGAEASIDGLRAGADDYLVKPFAASELLARVQANITLARVRGHHERWHDALIDSLQEAFFICDENGAVIEINAAFTEILGYGPDGLPYAAVHPWWPDAITDPEAYQLVQTAFEDLLHSDRGVYTVPVTHRDGHRLWVTFTFTHAADPLSGQRLTVGTLRDATAEHYRRRRDAALADLNHALVNAETVDQAVESTAAVVREIWQARRVVAALFANADVAGEPHIVVAGEPITWTDLPVAKRRFIESLCDADLLTPLTGGPGTAAIAVQHPDGLLVLWIELAENRPFTSPDNTLLAMLAGHFGQGLHRVHRLDQQHRTAVALQHAILGPAVLPNGFMARYRPATTPLQVGGDWYDVIDLADGRTGLIVGDCVGHGLDAATVMGQLRSACRALLLENPSPAAALVGLDRFAVQLTGARCTTVFCAVLDTDSGQFTYSNAGHPPPIILDADGSVRTLTEGRGIPVGVRPGRTRTDAHTALSGRATLLIYTDGLVERRGESLDVGITRAGDLLVEASTAEQSEGLADRLIDQMTPPGGYSDDVAMLLYRHPGPLHVSVPAEVGQLATTRDALRIWLQRNDIGAEQVQDLLVAVGEAIANSIEHGHRGGRAGSVTLTGTAHGARVHIRIVDTGEWKPAEEVPHPTRGRGLKLMRALTEDVAIHSDSLGTTVDMHARIS